MVNQEKPCEDFKEPGVEAAHQPSVRGGGRGPGAALRQGGEGGGAGGEGGGPGGKLPPGRGGRKAVAGRATSLISPFTARSRAATSCSPSIPGQSAAPASSHTVAGSRASSAPPTRARCSAPLRPSSYSSGSPSW
jgi:hypothetical protein